MVNAKQKPQTLIENLECLLSECLLSENLATMLRNLVKKQFVCLVRSSGRLLVKCVL